jgi:putative endonuclease
MNYLYVLKSERDGGRYIGSTNDLKRRIQEHNKGEVFSTRNRRPLKLFAVQYFDKLTDARLTEHKYKKSRGLYEKAIRDGLLTIIGET